jgi:hypothetical protein
MQIRTAFHSWVMLLFMYVWSDPKISCICSGRSLTVMYKRERHCYIKWEWVESVCVLGSTVAEESVCVLCVLGWTAAELIGECYMHAEKPYCYVWAWSSPIIMVMMRQTRHTLIWLRNGTWRGSRWSPAAMYRRDAHQLLWWRWVRHIMVALDEYGRHCSWRNRPASRLLFRPRVASFLTCECESHNLYLHCTIFLCVCVCVRVCVLVCACVNQCDYSGLLRRLRFASFLVH